MSSVASLEGPVSYARLTDVGSSMGSESVRASLRPSGSAHSRAAYIAALAAGTHIGAPEARLLALHLEPASSGPSSREWLLEFIREAFALAQQNDYTRRIVDLLSLDDDWDGYGAEAPTPEAGSLAEIVLRASEADNLTPERIVPSADGGIALHFFSPRNKRYASIECSNDGDVVVLIGDREAQIRDAWEIDPSDADLEHPRSLSSAISRIHEWIND